MSFNRRQFTAGAGLMVLSAGLARPSLAQGAPKVVIIGGGPGGATVANQIKSADPAIEVTLIEPKEAFTTCFYSNLFIGGFRSFASITHSYDGLVRRGIRVVHDTAAAVDTAGKTVGLAKGASVPYDRLVIAPGIDIKYSSIEGYSQEAAQIMPHAWQAGPQTLLLKEKLLAMSDGGVVVMAIPDNPFRCPPGPYERACMIAHFLKTRKPKSKLILFDAKKTFSKQSVFEEAFNEYYKDIIEVNLTNEIDDNAVARVDPATGDVTTRSGRTERAAVANIIPAQSAGNIAKMAGCTDGDWCTINAENFSSVSVRDVYVVGDAAIAADMPKSAFAAASQGTVVAADIVADLRGKPRTSGRYRNTCWSMLAPENSAKIGADYTAGMKDGKPHLDPHDSFISKPGESADLRRETYNESAAWYESFTKTLFAKDVQATAGKAH
ncbi:MAG TPA: NAD(P)/FAD-dependent oxidoreductase [Hyphomicrobium sp.]|nr:NAD(P)/FAD-dependent oxidoreductase [Hyphomicrobium sp.]